jgi:hypothetical protein
MLLEDEGVLSEHVRPVQAYGEIYANQEVVDPSNRKVTIRIYKK